jgi:hypothetical protein
MQMWEITGPIANTPNAHRLPTAISYIRQYALDMAYVALPGPHVTMKQFRHRIYSVLLTMANIDNGNSEIRIILKYPGLPRPRVWANLHAEFYLIQ